MLKPKAKPCKGTHETTKGYGCGKLTPYRVYGLGKMCGCYSDWLLNSEAGKLKIQKATLKATKPRRELEKATKEHKQRKGLTTLLKSVRNVCHEYIRKRDEGKPCISCGTAYKSDFDAGHLFKAELDSIVRFDERNIHGQCIQCNRYKEGNIDNYRLNLPHRIGKDAFNELEALASFGKRNGFKWERSKLNEIKNHYKSKIKRL